ncbi:MAG: penicillin acylase family protein [Myxococcota bacterium]
MRRLWAQWEVAGRGRWIGVVALLALAIPAGALLAQWLGERAAARAAFPQTDGRIAVLGVTASVEIFRDPHGVPHINAASESDAFFSLGFVHAQDRLAQMTWLLRCARGRTAELVGEEGLAVDRRARTLNLPGAADAQLERLDPATRDLLVAYARGVNARIERVRSGRAAMPVALKQLDAPLEDWTPGDTLAVLKLYAWGLSNTLDVSLVLSEMIEKLGGVAARRFFPGGSGGEVVPTPGRLPLTAGTGARQTGGGAERAPGRAAYSDPLRRAVGLGGRSVGSSAWVVGGSHTRSGMPLVAGDAHHEPTAPPLFYVAHLSGGDLDVAGATLPGVPVFWTGHNRNVAWVATNARAVTADLYVETLHPTDSTLYHDGRRWRPLLERVEVIRVRGSEDEELLVRSTRHGPLIGPLLSESREPLALSWVGTEAPVVSAVASLLGVARAGGAAELLSALERHDEPPLAVVYADRAGAAGMQVAGWLPRRALATGLVPVPGRAPWYDWRGRLDFEELPSARIEGGKGWAIAADNRFGREDGEPVEWLWRTGARAKRIDDLMRQAVQQGPLDLRGAARLQTDVGTERAPELVALALDLEATDPGSEVEADEVAGLLRAWDGRATAGSSGAAAYHVFVEVLTQHLLGRQLGSELLHRYLALPQVDPDQVVLDMVRSAAEGGGSDGWTDAERVRAAVQDSLREVWLRLSFRLGPNRSKWYWGRLHRVQFGPFGPTGLKGGGLGPIGPFSYGGSGSTVNAGGYDPGGSFDVRLASTYRFAAETGSLHQSLMALAPGQSEHPHHPHFEDGLERWLEGRPTVLATSRLWVEESSPERLVLERAPDPAR